MSELAARVDPLELDLLKRASRCVHKHALPQRDDPLLHARYTAFKQEEVVVDDTVTYETTHRRDLLLAVVELRCGIALVVTLTDAVDLEVRLCSVMVAHLTSTRDGPLDV